MRHEQMRDTRCQLLAGRDMQELIRAMGVRCRTEHSRNEELGGGKLLSQHSHKGDRTAFTHVDGWFAEVDLGSSVRRVFEPFREWWGIPAVCRGVEVYGHVGAVGRISR